VVKLDPSYTATQEDLVERFNLLMRIQTAGSHMDANLNRALAARTALGKLAASGGSSSAAAQAAIARLNRDITPLVDLQIQSSEGSLVYPDRLRSWLFRISSRVGSALAAPTPGMIGVANDYINLANQGSARLQADVAAADQLLKN
jgi:hypothetical protein